jgi:fumarate hydratase class II
MLACEAEEFGRHFMRLEHDSMGEIEVPDDALWGAQTQRALENFPVSKRTMPWSLIEALVHLKWAAAETNLHLGVLDREVAKAISLACAKLLEGGYKDQFPLDVFQTGSGTSTNMNVNEVIAHLASKTLGREVSPNDHVNASQSSNDVFPTAMHLALVIQTEQELLPALGLLGGSIGAKAQEFAEVVKAGRTHLMDAVPVTLGQEFSGYQAQIASAARRIEFALGEVAEVPLGGTATGTGLNAPPGFAGMVLNIVNERLGIQMREAGNHFEVHGARDSVVFLSGALKTLAAALYKLANDLRWMASGPKCGLAEIHLPDLQPGSSIMPGKVNPVIPEAVCQVAARVIGNDGTIAFAGAAGNFELNVMQPVIADAALDSVAILASVSRLLASKCVDGIKANADTCLRYALSSPAIGTALNPYIGYEKAAKVVKTSLETGKDIKTVAIEGGYLSEREADNALDVYSMTKGGIMR